MVEVVRIPKLGLSDYGDLVSWEVDEGEHVSEGTVIAILESEKASAEIEAPTDGVLLGQYVDEGTEIEIEVGKPLAVIGQEGESVPPLSEISEDGVEISGDDGNAPAEAGGSSDEGAAQQKTDSTDVKATPRAKRRANEDDVDLTQVTGTGPEGAITESDVESFAAEAETGPSDGDSPTDVKATPRAKRRANEDDIDLAQVTGTGPQGAITESDIESFVAETGDGDEPASTDTAGETDGLTVTDSRALTGVRRTIAERLSESARTKPHVMGTRDIEIERLEEVKDRLVDERGLEVSLNDLILHFVGRTLEDLPAFNAHFEDDAHRLIDEVNVGYAVNGDRGLIVPVIEDVPERTLGDLASRRRELVDAVLASEHTPSDLQGGTFTVTNVGVFDMDVSYSIINPPQVAILAIGRRKHVPVERNGETVFRRAITFSLTIDHRVLDGADSGAFLERLAEYIEYPGRAFDAV
ncbi:dihydrolipoamide acetyltransferase family protein [Natronomonas sp.]|uniref:dihydrolipoamide acetyltransferase family protein n=1 Tax=Natronomonas sp. TaxID=2184060 RepID=UPI003975B904